MLEKYQIEISKYKWGDGIDPPEYSTEFSFNYNIIGNTHFLSTTGTSKCINIKYIGSDNNRIVVMSGVGSSISFFKNGGYYNLRLPDSLHNFTLAQIATVINNANIPEFTVTLPDDGHWIMPQIPFDQYYFESGVPKENETMPNFFSKQIPTLVETITNFKDYLVDIGDLEYTFDNTDSNNGKSTLFYEDSDISFTCSGIKDNYKLYDFFGINSETDNIAYMIKINRNGELLWRGVVNQDSVEENFEPSDSSEQIQFQGLGFLKEFKSYFSNQKLLSAFYLTWETSGNERISLRNLLTKVLFPNDFVTFVLEPDLENFYITRNAGIFQDASTDANYTWFKEGYDRIYNGNPNESKWQFFVKFCNSWGWVFYFYQDKFYIKNRSCDTLSTETIELDYKKFLNYTAKKVVPKDFSTILLIDGYCIGGKITGLGSDMGTGNYMYIFTNIDDDLKVDVPFSHVLPNHNFYFNNGHRYLKYYNEETDWFRYRVLQWSGNNGSSHGARIVTIPQDDILRIECGGSALEGTRYDINNGINAPATVTDLSNPAFTDKAFDPQDFWFTGNYGNCLYKMVNGKYYTYLQHVKSTLFADNFAKYFDSNLKTSNKIDVEYNELLLNPLVTFTIMNSSELNSTDNWTVNKFSLNLKEETSKLELQKKLIA